jgi:general secretion pathway protein D
LRQVTTAQALDYIFLQESLFFQKLSRRTILVADQTRRPQYQQLVLRTFFLANSDPEKAKQLVGQAIPPSVGRPQTIVVADKDTNSLTIRDTAENVRLIGELIQSIDKDRAEVVMDVNIFEINKTDLMQFGNQLGTDATLVNLGGIQKGFSVLQGGAGTVGLPTALGSALLIPSSQLIALQSKSRGKLVASTQVHAFNGEESTARIGQRVPVQTAQAYPFGVQTSTGTTNNGFPTGGFPVINYEPTGLTLKFTPQVFPNQDVQVKMSIEAKDVLGATTLTPTFTERTITGTARVQNNKTMMLASVTTEVQSNGRKGLPIVSGLPWLGRLFSAPTSDDRVVDIVIAVTPRVLRAPAVTPRDLEMRPSGTLQSPTTGSLEAMLREADREDQLAELRLQQRNAIAKANVPTAPVSSPGIFPNVATTTAAPAPTTQAATAAANPTVAVNAQKNSVPAPNATNEAAAHTAAANTTSANAPAANTMVQQTAVNTPAANTMAPPSAVNTTAANTTAQPTAVNTTAANTTAVSRPAPNTSRPAEEMPAFVPAPKSLVSSTSATVVAAVNTNLTSDARATLTSMAAKPIASAITPVSTNGRTAQLIFGPADQSMRVGETRRFALAVKSDVPLAMAIVALRFDPKVVKVRAVGLDGSTATLTQSTDASGVCLVSISGISGTMNPGTLIYIDVEGISPGDAALLFDKDSSHLVAIDARDLGVEVTPARANVKQ